MASLLAMAALLMGGAGEAHGANRAGEPESAPAPAATTAANLLAEADAAVDAGNLAQARALFERLVAEHPDAPEVKEARRALKIIAAGQRGGVRPATPSAPPAPAPGPPS